MSCPADCECGGRTYAAVDARELYDRQHLREWFRAFVHDLPDADVIALNRVTIAAELAVQLSHDPGTVLALATYELQSEIRLSAEYHRQRWLLESEGPARQHERARRSLIALGPDAADRAARTDALIQVLAGAVFLTAASRAAELDRLVALTAAGGTVHQSPAYRAKVPTMADVRDQIRLAGDDRGTLGHQRDRLRLAGHPDIRELAGYGGRKWSGQHQEEAAQSAGDELPGSAVGSDQGRKARSAGRRSWPRRLSRGRRP